jgi:hypothetical protein
MGSVEEARDRTVRMVLRAAGDEDEIRGALEGFEASIRNSERRAVLTRKFCTKTPGCRLADGHQRTECVR